MSRFIKKYRFAAVLLLLAALVIPASCSKEDPFPGGETSDTGRLSLDRMMVSVANSKQTTDATRAVSVDDFTVDILKGSETIYSWRYADMPSVVELPVGEYTAKAHLGTPQTAAFEAPYYEGEESFSIRKDEITEVKTIECRLGNVRVTILFDDALKAQMGSDCKVNVVMGSEGSLDFTAADEARSGYFAYVEGSNTMVATFTGTVNGAVESSQKLYRDVAPGNHYRITYRLHTPGPDPNAEGTCHPGVVVDAYVEVVDVHHNVDPDDPKRPEDDKRPHEGDDPQNPDDPKENAPVLTAIINGAEVSWEGLHDVNPTSTVKVNITSEKGITGFKVIINSEALTPEELEGFGLSQTLDLVNPGACRDGLVSLQLPIEDEVRGKGVDGPLVFDISRFMAMLVTFGEMEHDFVLEVTDDNGTTTKTLRLNYKLN